MMLEKPAEPEIPLFCLWRWPAGLVRRKVKTPRMKTLLILAFALTGVLRAEAAPTKILFIGNSLTYCQKGIYFHLEKLASSAVPAAPLQTEKAVKGGASLRTLWELPEPRERIAKDAGAIVVLQEDIPETTLASFRE